MECVIGKENVKIFAQVINTLGKIGPLTSFDVRYNMLCCIAFNGADSACNSYNLKPNFFEKYNGRRSASRHFKIPSKNLMSIFRGALSNVDKITIKVHATEDAENRVIITLITDIGMEKVYKLVYEEAQVRQAINKSSEYPVTFECKPKLLNVCLSNFHNNIDEITFVLESSLKVSNKPNDANGSGNGSSNNSEESNEEVRTVLRIISYLEDPTNIKSTLNTTMTIDTTEFETLKNTLPRPRFEPNNVQSRTGQNGTQYSVEKLLEMTFNYKNLKHYLTFCESALQSVQLFLNHQGAPLYCRSLSSDRGDIDSELLLATISVDESQEQSSQTGSDTTTGTKVRPDDISSFTTDSSGSKKRKRVDSPDTTFSSPIAPANNLVSPPNQFYGSDDSVEYETNMDNHVTRNSNDFPTPSPKRFKNANGSVGNGSGVNHGSHNSDDDDQVDEDA